MPLSIQPIYITLPLMHHDNILPFLAKDFDSDMCEWKETKFYQNKENHHNSFMLFLLKIVAKFTHYYLEVYHQFWNHNGKFG